MIISPAELVGRHSVAQGSQLGLTRCTTSGCHRWLPSTPGLGDAHVCGGRHGFDELKRLLLRHNYSSTGPLEVQAHERVDVFASLSNRALTSQAALLRSGAGCARDEAGEAAATRWASTGASIDAGWALNAIRNAIGRVRRRPADTGSASPFSEVMAWLLAGWIVSVIGVSGTGSVRRAHGTLPATSVLNSVVFLEEAIRVDIPHWWDHVRCDCDRSHAWIAPLSGWIEVLLTADTDFLDPNGERSQ